MLTMQPYIVGLFCMLLKWKMATLVSKPNYGGTWQVDEAYINVNLSRYENVDNILEAVG